MIAPEFCDWCDRDIGRHPCWDDYRCFAFCSDECRTAHRDRATS